MKNGAFFFFASIAALLSFVSCTDEQPLEQIVMTTQDFQLEVDARTAYQITDGAVKCTWGTNDMIGVFPNIGAQIYFPIASGAGTKNATFDSKDWALNDGSIYGAYYPITSSTYLNREAVPVSYIGQTQSGNVSMEHLGGYDYMVATPTTPKLGSAQFTFKHLSALIQLKITIPQPVTLNSVKLITDTEAFAIEGTVDIMAENPSITPVASSKEFELNLQDVVTTEPNQVIMLYMMLPPTDLSGQTLRVRIMSDKGIQEIALAGKNFQAGTAYTLSGELDSVFSSYKDGVVTITKAGMMKQLLGDDCLNITSLKVVGPINGDDVICLRKMLACIGTGYYEKGKLTSLDLSEASIVKGGSYYYNFSAAKYNYTSNDMIGENMFRECLNLQNIVLPAGVTEIGASAFKSCASLTSIDIPDSVTEIGDYAFESCASLTSIDIPDSVTNIGNYAYRNCSSLTSIHIPDGVTKISEGIFWSCGSLASIHIPDTVTKIGASAFYGCHSLASINIPDGVTEISNKVFALCQSLTSINIPESVIEIGEGAFWGCSTLTSIDIPDGVTEIGASAFKSCVSLTSIDIPDNVTVIKASTFEDCHFLTSINIPESVIEIGEGAFYDCGSLTSIDIPDGVTEISNNVFALCSSLTSIDISENVTSIGASAFYGCSLASIDIPDGVTTIGAYAFECCPLASIDIPDGVTTIGASAFAACSSLESVHITDLSAWCNISFSNHGSNPLNNGAKLYVNNNELTELVIPSNIKNIKDYAFYGYKSITKVTMGEQVTSVGIQSFYDCTSLTQAYCYGTTPPTINPSFSTSSFSGSYSRKTLYVPTGCSSAYQSAYWSDFFGTIEEMK